MTADLGEKLSILAGAAKYDASCASSGTSGGGGRGSSGAAFGVRVPAGVCHSWTGDGRCVSLLKVLYSNVCRYDCAYCANRVSADTKRVSFTPDELIRITTEFYRRNYIEGLFLSSGIFADPDIVMEKLILVARTLRKGAGYGGYIHLKIIPGSGERLIREAGRWADRLSANIELPTERSLQALAPQKSGKLIFGAMGEVREAAGEVEEDRRRGLKKAPVFAPAGQSTQLVVGASAEDDRTIIGLTAALYRKYALRRVYYSAYTPVGVLPAVPLGGGLSSAAGTVPPAPLVTAPPGNLLLREHRLYQADWLLRFYQYRAAEILDEAHPWLDSVLDPKAAWAVNHLEFFPLEVKTAAYEELLRVPGLGVHSARRIVELRRSRSLSFDGLRRLGVVFKRARYFITLNGRFYGSPGGAPSRNPAGRAGVLENPARARAILSGNEGKQLPLFDPADAGLW
ncbi:MAG: putative DNA modification/repair radical SAM protein [Treponema sp.]|jgi:putative DNA modification/repair radical SAM protein|nr:putative DNA modification/repair radical SAM protein [Treponema sp.]